MDLQFIIFAGHKEVSSAISEKYCIRIGLQTIIAAFANIVYIRIHFYSYQRIQSFITPIIFSDLFFMKKKQAKY